jgi:hypothetical protein
MTTQRAAFAAAGHIDAIDYIDPFAVSTHDEPTVVPKGSVIVVRGWAALVASPGLGRVFVAIDDHPPLEATYGLERLDIVAAFADDAFARTGFEAACSSAHLAPGPHRLRVAIVDEAGEEHVVDGPMPFEIDATLDDVIRAADTTEAGAWIVVDRLAVDDAFAEEPLDAGATSIVRVRGWAIEEGPGTGSALFGVIGSTVVRARYGLRRDDVAATLGAERFAECGFDLDVPMEAVPPGPHVVHLRLLGRDGTTVYAGPHVRVDVAAPAHSDEPAAFASVIASAHIDRALIVGEHGALRGAPADLRLVRGERLFVSGWAIDEASDALARGVAVCVDEMLSFRALYGHDRDDVAASFERPELGACGFTALVPTASMPSGPHVLTLRVIARDGRHFFEASERIAFTVVDAP